MIPFFRKIRQQLLTENRFSRYLIYALGEIILVVIGILIALSINNQNQNRIIKSNEQTYLLGLKEEFQTSKAKLIELIAVNQGNYNGAKRILEYTSDSNTSPTEEEFSVMLYSTFSSDIAFNPNNSLLLEMVNSGILKYISNTELRIQLTNWLSTLEDISKQEIDLGIQREKVLDMFRTNETSLKTIFEQAGVYDELGLPKAGAQISNLELLKSTEFQNNTLMFILASYATEISHYNPLKEDVDRILMLIDQEINE